MNSLVIPDERVLTVEFGEDTLSVSLRDGRVISVPLVWFPRLLNASKAERKNWKIAGGGYGIHWPDLDEDLSTDGLLRGAPAPKQANPISATATLSNRQKELLQLIANGCTNREIANQLGLTEQVVRTHIQRILRKLRLNDRREAVQFLSLSWPATRVLHNNR